MGTNRLRSWRGGATSVVLWALLATAASVELYEEGLPEVDYPSYQDENSIDSGSVQNQKMDAGPDLALAKDVLLYRLIKSLQRDSHSRPHSSSESHQQYRLRVPDFAFKDLAVKRLTNILKGDRNLGFRSLDQMYRPQQKWKIKKGKSLGNQMVCYFKLCAFRSPI